MSGLGKVEMSGSRYVTRHVGPGPDHEQTRVRARSFAAYGIITECADGGALEAKVKSFTVNYVFSVLVLSGWLLGCSSDEDFSFSEADIRASIAGKYEGSISATSERVHMTLDEAGVTSMQTNDDAGVSTLSTSISRRSVLCESRQFGVLESKCGASSTMYLVGNITSEDGVIPASTLAGSIVIYGSDLTGGTLELTTGSGDTISAEFASRCCVNWTYRKPVDAQFFSLDMTHQ